MRMLNLAEEFYPVPKPRFGRRKPTLKQRGEFSPKTVREIKQRDGEHCQECGNPRSDHTHHVKPKGRSGNGRGVATNGLRVCFNCHDKIHKDRKLMLKWQRIYEERYGPDYYKDQWD